MPIDQKAVVDMVAACVETSNVGRKVYFCENGNLMTAMNYFRKITGQKFDLGIPVGGPGSAQHGVARTATFSSSQGPIKSFQFNVYKERVGNTDVTVTLRGGSSSPVATERYVLTSGKDDGSTVYTQDLPGVPTLEFQNPSALTGVPAFLALGDRMVEIKFTTRYEFTSARSYVTSI